MADYRQYFAHLQAEYLRLRTRKQSFGFLSRSDTIRTVQSQKQAIKKTRICTIPAAKTKALISCAVTAQLIFVFAFSYACCWFSHAAAQLRMILAFSCGGNVRSLSKMSRLMRKLAFCVCENKDADHLISAFVFARRIVQSLFFLNPTFQASSLLL